MTKLTDAERAAMKALRRQISDASGDGDDASWGYEQGVLISRNNAIALRDAIRRLTSPAATTEQGLDSARPNDTTGKTDPVSAPVPTSPAPDTAALLEFELDGVTWKGELVEAEYVDGHCALPAAVCWTKGERMAEGAEHRLADRVSDLAAALRAEQEKVKDISHGISVAQIVAADTLIKELQQRVAEVEAECERIRKVALELASEEEWHQRTSALAQAADAGDLTCKKVPHIQKGGYLHAANDDSPFDVDGVMYCGRCHSAWPCSSSRPTVKP